MIGIVLRVDHHGAGKPSTGQWYIVNGLSGLIVFQLSWLVGKNWVLVDLSLELVFGLESLDLIGILVAIQQTLMVETFVKIDWLAENKTKRIQSGIVETRSSVFVVVGTRVHLNAIYALILFTLPIYRFILYHKRHSSVWYKKFYEQFMI